MSNRGMLASLAIAGAVLGAPCPSSAQNVVKGSLGTAGSVTCAFSVVASGTWGDRQPSAEVKPVELVLVFEAINADEGTAQLKDTFGRFDIIVRYAHGYLHFIQSFLDGPLHTTTVLEKQTAGRKWKAMHSRHEYKDVILPGFTSRPEQYYGECEIGG